MEKLAPFRDKPEFHNIGGISDRAMLRLGLALIAAKNPEGGRTALETMLNRFGNGNPYASEARFGFAQALQAQLEAGGLQNTAALRALADMLVNRRH